MLQLKTTLLIIVKDNQILLAKKLRGFGMGKYNGVGGKVEQDETVEQAILRETFEEIGVVPTEYKMMGIVDFDEYVKGERNLVKMHVFKATQFDGEPTTTDEMSPEWFSLDNIPYDKMFKDDTHWLPLLLQDKTFYGNFVYDKDFNLVEYKLDLT